MTDVLIDRASRQILQWGQMEAPSDPAFALIHLNPAEAIHLLERGDKTLNLNGTITVTPPVDPLPLPQPDYGADVPDRDALITGVAQLRTYLALPSPTQAQSTAALKLLIRGFLFVLKRMLT